MNNNNANEDPNNRNSSNRSKQIIFILVIYIMLVMSSKFGNKNEFNIEEKLITVLKTDQVPKLSVLFGIFQTGSVYQGYWQKIGNSQNSLEQIKDYFHFKNSGKSKVQFTGTTDTTINFGLLIENGQYLDDGYLYSAFNLKNQENKTYISTKRQGNSAIVTVQASQNITLPTTTYKIQRIFNTLQIGITTIDKIVFNFTLVSENKVKFQTELYTAKTNLRFNIFHKETMVLRTIFFAFLVFIISYFSFNSVLLILRQIIEGSQSPQKYSLMSVLIATLWDSIICLVCFIQAFTNQQNLILFILPSFMLCILFTNLELRWMLSIFQSNNSHLDLRSVICRFNIISYGSFLLIYPILLFTNLNSWLFISISLIFLPQILVNAQKGIRPDLNHAYYSKFLMFRFIIIFYLRGFPLNIFELKPDYVVCLLCLVLIAAQYTLLWIQKVYGPKKIVPNFLLPPIFNYKLEEQINIEVGGEIPQCAICLSALHLDPDFHQPQMKNEYDKVKLMKTPCNHKYHSKCLIEWMNIKKQCPQCRTALPAFQ